MSEDAKFTIKLIAGIAAFVLFLVGLFSLLDATFNLDEWTESTDNCFVHTYEDNRLFGDDSGSITELCPVER